ncbi:MAG: carbohydrate porin [Methyloglobulus sp.]
MSIFRTFSTTSWTRAVVFKQLLGLVCLFFTWMSVVSADEAASIEASKQLPISKSLWERTTLTDDWFGTGTTLREHGIGFSGSLTQFYQVLAAGTGSHDWKYGGKADGFLRIDGAKLGLWKGFGLNAHAELNYGESPTSAGGTFLPNNLALAFPGANNTFADLSLYFTQQLGDDITVMFGKINMIDLYDAGREFSGGRGIEQFQHVQFVAPISGITPPTILGGIVSVKTKPAKYTLMIYDPANQVRKTGFENPFDKGVTFNGSVELPSNFFGRSGKHVFSAAYSTQNGIDFADIPQLLLPEAPPPGNKGDRWYLSYAFEQSLWRDAVDPQKAWGLFGQVAVSDGNPNPVEWSVMGGIGGTSPIPGRERDKFGLGLFYVGYSSQLKDSLRLLLPARDESGLEVFYNYSVTPWLRLTADAQFIRPPRSDRDTAIMTGIRAQILF